MSQTIRGAVLDLGSNTFKLLLAEQRGQTLTIHHESAIPVRIGAGVEKNKKLNNIPQALRTLKNFRKKIEAFGAKHLIAAATSAVRSAKNKRDFLQPAKEILGVPVQVLNGAEEARLIYRGIATAPEFKNKAVFHIDLGAGSVEIIHGKQAHLQHARSIPVGCVRMRDLFFSKQPASEKCFQDAEAFLKKGISKNSDSRSMRSVFSSGKARCKSGIENEIPDTASNDARGKKRPYGREISIFRSAQKKFTRALKASHPSSSIQLTGAGGTIFSIIQILEQPERSLLTLTQLKKLQSQLAPLTRKEIKRLPRLPEGREDILLPGLVILIFLMEELGRTSLRFTRRGLRHGLWTTKIAPFQKLQLL